jgi:hypothetical protein
MFRTVRGNDIELKTNKAASQPGFVISFVWNGTVIKTGYFCVSYEALRADVL